VEMLRELANTSPKILQQKYFPAAKNPEGALNNWMQRIRIRLERSQWYVNNINNLTRQSKYLKKRLISTERPEGEEEAE